MAQLPVDPGMLAQLAGGAMGGGAGGNMGGAIAQVLQKLMQNPAAVQGMQNFLQGRPPTAGIPQPMPIGGQGVGRGPSTDGDLYAAQEANQGVRGNLRPMPDTGGYTGYGEEYDPMPDPRQTPMPPEDDAEAMAADQIDKAGATFDGTNAPTKNDIERLLAEPTDSMVEAFDAQFGDGMSAKYISPEGEGEQEDAPPEPDGDE